VPVTGLTSAGHYPFVAGLGLYDQVVTYDRAETRPAAGAVLADIAGKTALRDRIGRHAGRPAQVVTAGLTHPDAAGTPGGRAGVGFFVPDETRARAREWGWPDLEQRFGAVLGGFAGGSVPLYAIQLALALGAPAVRYLDEDPASLALAEALGAQVSDGPLPRKLGSYAVTVDASLNVRGLGCALRSTGRTASAPASESTCRTLPSRCSTCT
jgi:hypothetical protein